MTSLFECPVYRLVETNELHTTLVDACLLPDTAGVEGPSSTRHPVCNVYTVLTTYYHVGQDASLQFFPEVCNTG